MAVVAILIAVSLAVAQETVPIGTAISNALGGGFNVQSLIEKPVTLTWVNEPPEAIWIGQSFNCSVNTTSLSIDDGGQDFTNALFVIKVEKDGVPAGQSDVTVIAEDRQALGYDVAGGFFYWGPRTGFSLPAGYDVTTEFTVTPRVVGNFSFTIWCVDLTSAE